MKTIPEPIYCPNATESPRIYTRCPACGNDTLAINHDKHLLCTWITCPDPTLISRVRERIANLEGERDMARIVKGDRCWFLAGWVRHLKNVLKLADEHRDDLGAALRSAVAERDILRDKLANARGWIMANATKPVHDLLRAIEP